jgi:hypothetical protein
VKTLSYHINLIFFVSFLLSGLAFAENSPAAFYPEFKIDPVSGSLVGYPGETVESLKQRFNLCDKNGNITLSAFAGETVAVQFLTPADPTIKIVISNPPGTEFALYQVGCVKIPKIEETYFPDILIPLTDKSPGAELLVVEDREVIPAASKYYLFWLEVPLDANSQGKSLSLKLQISTADFQQAVSVNVDVKNQPLPPPALWLDLNEYGDKYLYIFHDDHSDRELLEIEEKVFRMARAHEGIMNPLPYKSQKGEAREGMAPKILNEDLLHPLLDWSEFDARFGNYFDGSAFVDGQPIRHFYLPFNPDWPAPFELYYSDRGQYENIWAAFAQVFIKHFQEKGWTETVFQLYCNQKPGKLNNIPWNLDEPKGVDDYKALRYYADLTHRVFAGSGPLKVRFRIDIAHFYCDEHRGSRDKDFRVNGGADILKPVDIWGISDHSLNGEFAAERAKALLAEGKEVWVYGETPLINDAGYHAINSIYAAREKGLTGFLIWKSVARELHRAKGSDFIYYTVKVNGKKDVLPSVRLKLLKRGIDDTRIFEHWLAGGDMRRSVIEEMLKEYRTGDPESIWKLRNGIHRPNSGRIEP